MPHPAAEPSEPPSRVRPLVAAALGAALGYAILRYVVVGTTPLAQLPLFVVNKAIANLDASADLVITQNQLTDRARQKTPDALHVSVDNFMNSPKYDEVVELVRDQHQDGA